MGMAKKEKVHVVRSKMAEETVGDNHQLSTCVNNAHVDGARYYGGSKRSRPGLKHAPGILHGRVWAEEE